MMSSSSLYESRQFERVDSLEMSVLACSEFASDVKITPNILCLLRITYVNFY